MRKTTRLIISRLNSTGVQELKFKEIKLGHNIEFEGEKYLILSIKKGRGKVKM